MDVQTRLMTVEEFEQSPLNTSGVELVRGEISTQMSPTGAQHGEVAGVVFAALFNFAHGQKLGKVYAAETGFILSQNPATVRAPDAAFVSRERAVQQRRPEGYFEGAPDLAVEVVSPGDRDEEVQRKVMDYLEAGTKLVWIVRPRTETVTVYRSLTDIRVLTKEETLDGGDLLPGFQLSVGEIFEG